MVGRGELTDAAWAVIEPMLPPRGTRGTPWADHRRVINGILWKLRTGAPWRDLPERFGPWQTCHARLGRWRQDGTWDRLLAHVQTKSGGDLGGEHRQHRSPRAPARRGGAEKGGAADGADGEALGRSRGGLTTKLHLACDGRGRPLAVVVTPGQRHDRTQLGPVLDAIRVPRSGGQGRPRKRPDRLIGDKGYSYDRCRTLLRRRGIPHTIPERCVNRLTQWRGIATRFEKRAATYRAMVVIASTMRWLDP